MVLDHEIEVYTCCCIFILLSFQVKMIKINANSMPCLIRYCAIKGVGQLSSFDNCTHFVISYRNVVWIWDLHCIPNKIFLLTQQYPKRLGSMYFLLNWGYVINSLSLILVILLKTKRKWSSNPFLSSFL